MMFTSGTTGAPKGVMATHGQTLRAFADWASIVGLSGEDRYLVVNPFFHTFGYKAGIVAAMTTGATLYPLPTFDLDEVLETIETHAITVLPGAPTIYQSILQVPDLDVARLTSLRLAVTGAAVVPVQLVRDMGDVLGFDTVLTAYGLTEACGIATISGHDADAETVANFSGRAFPGVEVRTVDDEGRSTPPMEPGEVVVRGYNVMRGYHEDPERTAEAIDADGWLHTGDVGVMDERGYLRITDRLKDMFIVGGFNVYPAEVEALLSAHDDVAQVAVVGVPDERMGEVGYAFVVPAAGSAPTPVALIEWARDRMANFKVPREIELVEALPVNPSGKVLKFELRERAAPTRKEPPS
jgi:acyl-CoA synthetase (AMP-forming)/AMP-acid ligase II